MRMDAAGAIATPDRAGRPGGAARAPRRQGAGISAGEMDAAPALAAVTSCASK